MDKLDYNKDNLSSCRIWKHCLQSKGYPIKRINNKTTYVHRHVYSCFLKRELKSDEFVCHKCDNPACIKLEHLFLGSQVDNMKDMVNKRRYCPKPTKGSFKPGEKHRCSKLTEKEVRKIKSNTTFSQKELAEMYNISRSQISRIKNGVDWSHVKV